jgi:hypothetical protein
MGRDDRPSTARLSFDQCFNFDPPLRTREGSLAGSDKRPIPAAEAFDLKVEIVRQILK